MPLQLCDWHGCAAPLRKFSRWLNNWIQRCHWATEWTNPTGDAMGLRYSARHTQDGCFFCLEWIPICNIYIYIIYHTLSHLDKLYYLDFFFVFKNDTGPRVYEIFWHHTHCSNQGFLGLSRSLWDPMGGGASISWRRTTGATPRRRTHDPKAERCWVSCAWRMLCGWKRSWVYWVAESQWTKGEKIPEHI